ncbi:MAG: muropeptide transporter AmpG [Betaproteobacteria bacterium HGW-Betaproteobacteria-1]|jgi:PAT family beta-lactamase induction signal transducer AmpG|nr:MAG: muropeptide transporter AmpG [Betaproteobacteria bacterium HGW-Betaproteobacteria-1]
MNAYLEIFRNRRVAVVCLLGFSSGLPLALTSGTLQAWMTVSGVDLATIGIFTLVGIPYTWKFLWAPFMDRYVPPFLGRRRGWIAAMQMLLGAGIAIMGALDPVTMPWALAALALMVAFVSASQDVVFDAYRADVLRPAERGIGAAVSVLGYRLAMLVSGALALILSDQIGWQNTYWLMAALMIAAIGATLFGPEPEVKVTPPKTLTDAVIEPLREFFARHGAWGLLLLIVLYKLGDAFAGSLTTAFLIRGVDFTPTEVGAINKGMGLAATLVGVVFGGILMTRLGLFRSLLAFGILQAISNLTFMWLAAIGKDYAVMVLAVGFENLAGGMGTAAFVALLMGMCDKRFTASQFALLSALAAVGRVYVGPASGYMVESIGWTTFFGFTFLIALPGLLLLFFMRRSIEAMGRA